MAALNIKNEQVERLATEVARIAGETKTEAIRRALEDRKMRLALKANLRDRTTQLKEYLEREVWPQLPVGARRKKMLSANVRGFWALDQVAIRNRYAGGFICTDLDAA
jgi:antitoxin VapB